MSIESELLGPTYPYYNNIKTPEEHENSLYNEMNELIPYISEPLDKKFFTGTQRIHFSDSKGVIPLTMETIETNNNNSSETHFVTLVDTNNMDPNNTKESFSTPLLLPKDPIVQLYFFGLSMIGIYILYKFMEKGN
jgi:hypothetical protein